MYEIKIKNEQYRKASPSLKKNIDKALIKLSYLIQEQENYGVSFEKIFNNPAIKYDIFPNQFYTFKHHCNDSAQLRILYKFIRDKTGTATIELHGFHHKKRNNKCYIKEFENFAQQYKEHCH